MKSLDKAIRKLRSARSSGAELRFVEIYRHLTKQGFQCVVVAPSLIPRKAVLRPSGRRNRSHFIMQQIRDLILSK